MSNVDDRIRDLQFGGCAPLALALNSAGWDLVILCDRDAGSVDIGFLEEEDWTVVTNLPGAPKHVLARTPRGGLVDASGYNPTNDVGLILATGMVAGDPVVVDVARKTVEAAISQRQLHHTPNLENKAASAADAIQRLEATGLNYDSVSIADEIFG